jgi:DHA3 family macrolide efflux protein-like MFS transporter
MTESSRRSPGGMIGFVVVWVGQFTSMVGTGMTRFALTIWAYELTGQATALALVGFFAFAPVVIFSPLAGVLVDRVDRKLVMIASDLAAGLATVTLLILHLTGHLQLWHLFAAGFFAGAFESFQFPAYSAAITLMLDKRQYTRANAMIGLADSASAIIAPALAGALFALIGIRGIMTLDIVTFLVAIATLLVVFIPSPLRQEPTERPSLLRESVFGFRYIFGNRSLLGLQLVFFASNFITVFGFTVLAPMILARTGNNEVVFGTVQMMFGVGGVVGGALVAAWGGLKRRVHGVLLGMIFSSLFGTLILGLGRGLIVWSIGAFASMIAMPLINGSNQSIWQSKIPPAIQGKVFATRRLIAQISAPIAMLAAGPLADRVFEPLMTTNRPLASFLALIVGRGPGSGMAVMFVIAGFIGALVGLLGYAFAAVRNAEDLLPDFDETPTANEA